MKKHIPLQLAATLALLTLIVFVPANAKAATVYLESSQSKVSAGDIVIITAKINADTAVINTVEGEFAITSPADGASIQEFSLGGSSFGLWPRTPSLSKDGRLVSFVGGVPGGFNFDGATLFKMVMEMKKEGTVTISPRNMSAYISDGKGTKVPVQLKNLVINVGPRKTGEPVRDEWKSVVAGDTVAPEDFVVVLGQDKNLFDGKKFAFFSAVDNQSGIAYYEVSENGGKAVRSGSTYVLQDQDADVELSVVAFDKAGNKKVSSYPDASTSTGINWLFIIIAVVVIAVLWFVIKKIFRSKNRANTMSPLN